MLLLSTFRNKLRNFWSVVAVKNRRRWFLILVLVFICFLISLWLVGKNAEQKYQSLLSTIIYDRADTPLSVQSNSKDHYAIPLENLPADFSALLLLKEDRYFRYHFGVNPVSTVRAIYRRLIGQPAGGASTITQQLAKNLLGTEQDRTLANKLRETFYSFGLELYFSKDELLVMYANTVYLGNQLQGFESGSLAYFGKPLRETNFSERISLLSTLAYPNSRHPWQKTNQDFAKALSQQLAPAEIFVYPKVTSRYSFQNSAFFELQTLGVECASTCHSTIDTALTAKIRAILADFVAVERARGATNGAVVVLNPQTSEIIALVGSKNPKSIVEGDQINMALMPRPIGSTVKPFIYLEGFAQGLRPYSLVDDREYKYPIATGFPLYPKNYDGQYYGEVTLHQALSNSLNVPTLKTLEYVGLPNFYSFLDQKLHFQPIQSYDNYQYGIALGGLEMDLLTLTHYFSIFPRLGTIAPLRILQNNFRQPDNLPPQANITKNETVAEEKYIQLVHAVLSDRLTGVNQFGLKSSLNIEAFDYGVKTGTSRDFHDSWVVGYTGDFVVGVWVGNTENTALNQVTGQTGAGTIWHEVMNLLVNSPYYTNTSLPQNLITLLPITPEKNENDWGLPDDIISEHRTRLLEDRLIASPHHGDLFEFFPDSTIPLISHSESLRWTVNGESVGEGQEVGFKPTHSGNYEIVGQAENSDRREIIQISVIPPSR